MEIDEAIEVMKNAFIECVENHTELNVVDANVDIQNALEELQWYREQDLIKIEDVISVVSAYYELGVFARWGLLNRIEKQIPKAEPPFATDTNVGDKECKECNESLV